MLIGRKTLMKELDKLRDELFTEMESGYSCKAYGSQTVNSISNDVHAVQKELNIIRMVLKCIIEYLGIEFVDVPGVPAIPQTTKAVKIKGRKA